MHMSNCPYCQQFEKGYFTYNNQNFGNRILYDSGNFMVFPSLGQIVEGYLLIATKAHYTALGQMPQELLSELESVQQRVKEVLSANYAVPLFFEHGTISETIRGGTSVDHAHMHAVPTPANLLEDLPRTFSVMRFADFHALKEQFETSIPYLFYESQSGEKFLLESSEPIVSQFFRLRLASKLGVPEKGNWRDYPGLEELVRTKERLTGLF